MSKSPAFNLLKGIGVPPPLLTTCILAIPRAFCTNLVASAFVERNNLSPNAS